MLKRLSLALLIAGLLGCETLPGPAPVVDSAPEPSGEVKKPAGLSAVDLLLKEAERAFAEDRLTTPEHNNAYDRYRAVLQVSPGNQAAEDGLNHIAGRYLELALAAKGASGKSAHFLAKADQIGRGREGYQQRRDRLMTLLRDPEPRVPPAPKPESKPEHDSQMEWRLDTKSLSRKDNDMIELLNRAGLRIKNNRESVLIIVRNDAEGRWVYGQLKKAADGYRVRGDIQLSKLPKLVFLPPL